MTPIRLGLPRSQLIMGVVLAAILVTMAVLQNQSQSVEPYDPDETGDSGLRALALWLEELGHPVTLGVQPENLSTGLGLLLIHPNIQGNLDNYSESDVTLTYEWVERGGTLVLVGPIDP